VRIACIGGGPASLYFAVLMKKAHPDAEIEVIERNRADDTFGWGVVFSDETLGNFQAADPESYGRITEAFATWGDIDTWVGDTCVRSTGHGFCGLARRSLLRIFHERCRELGVSLRFEREVADVEALRGADLVVGGDGVMSRVRETYADRFRPTVEWGRCRFSWLGTTLPLTAFTFVFRENEHGLFVVHAYPFERERSTWIVECAEETWKRAGLDRASEDDTVRYAEALFADHLKGHRLLTNKSIWRRFPLVRCERWHHENVVLLGDAAHTAHFSIGSGTKLAMEDSIALVDAFRREGTKDVPRALRAYEEARRTDVSKTQRAASVSQRWFEDAARWRRQAPVPFTFNLMTRSKRITYDNLARRDPALVRRVREGFAREHGAPAASDGAPPPPLFVPFTVRGTTLRNRVVVSPMCMYSATDGVPGEWQLVHLGARAVGGAGLVFTEMTDVSPEGRITHGCAGMWDDRQEAAWKRIVAFVHEHTPARIGMQLAHAGRKGSTALPWEGGKPLEGPGAWTTLAPSPIPFDEGWPAPREMTAADLALVVSQFRDAARRARRAGFDVVEVHMAHGYLLSSFLTPLSNARTDAYGGSLENRLRFPVEVLRAVREGFGSDRPVFARISASDWMPDGSGVTEVEAVDIARALAAAGCDLIDVSSGGTSPAGRPVYGRMYQAPFADRIRHEAGVPVMSVGGIEGWDHVNTLLAAGRADLCAIARGHLLDPSLTQRASLAYGFPDHPWPKQYLPARPRFPIPVRPPDDVPAP
jgi:anthraniloyl-CoA monooxygenase